MTQTARSAKPESETRWGSRSWTRQSVALTPWRRECRSASHADRHRRSRSRPLAVARGPQLAALSPLVALLSNLLVPTCHTLLALSGRDLFFSHSANIIACFYYTYYLIHGGQLYIILFEIIDFMRSQYLYEFYRWRQWGQVLYYNTGQ